MTEPKVAEIVASDMTVSDKIRALAAAGFPRADIARVLGKRYQHVRNVLEADLLRSVADRPRETGSGVEEASEAFKRSHRLSLEPGGIVRLSPELLDVLQVR